MSDAAVSSPEQLLEPWVGENMPMIKDLLEVRPRSTRDHPTNMTALNEALHGTAITISDQFVQLRPDINSWVYDIFPREDIDDLVYVMRDMQIPPPLMLPGPEFSAPTLVDFQMKERKGQMERFHLGAKISMDDALT